MFPVSQDDASKKKKRELNPSPLAHLFSRLPTLLWSWVCQTVLLLVMSIRCYVFRVSCLNRNRGLNLLFHVSCFLFPKMKQGKAVLCFMFRVSGLFSCFVFLVFIWAGPSFFFSLLFRVSCFMFFKYPALLCFL